MAVVVLLLCVAAMPAASATLRYTISVDDTATVVRTGLTGVAVGSDSLFCDSIPLLRHRDYRYDPADGSLHLLVRPTCDSLVLVVFQLPDWLLTPSGNAVPPGKRFLRLDSGDDEAPSAPSMEGGKINLSGNKSFSFNVGRSGQGYFSQGLNIDFDARLAGGVHMRGSVSDRIGSGSQIVSSGGGTTVLSELDKYYFEIAGPRVLARGGDIETGGEFLPPKRIRGVLASYHDRFINVSADIGRPAGKFAVTVMQGSDGRQGPYQVRASSGLPTGVVPGSETVYLDGRLLEGGSDRNYVIDYASGRITFSPRVLITSRSRIEVDFEAADTDYEQIIIDAGQSLRLFDNRLIFDFGARRESDEKERLRFTALSDDDRAILEQAGDSADLTVTSGGAADSSGDYVQVIDSTENIYYVYVGRGEGDHTVTFSFVGDGRGEYLYQGDGVYRYAGAGQGDYLPVVFLPLPSRTDSYFLAGRIMPYPGGEFGIDFRGTSRDRNLYSPLDDGDNNTGQLSAYFQHRGDPLFSHWRLRFRSRDYTAAYRLDIPDNNRLWALPALHPAGDELRLTTNNTYKTAEYTIDVMAGWQSVKDYLRSYRVSASARLWNDARVSPRLAYQSGDTRGIDGGTGDGLYEKYESGLVLRAARRLRFELDYERELARQAFDTIPDVERYSEYRASTFYRNTVLTFAHRIDFRSAEWGYKGPQLNKVVFNSEETIGRLNVSLGGTWLELKKLDSDRNDRIERLFTASFRYSGGGWLALQADYRQNRRSGRGTGYRYIYVGSGQGEYRLEDGQYLFDPDGDYLRIREERGDAVSTTVGEKNHNLIIYPGRLPSLRRYRAVLSQIALRLRTELFEEFPGADRRRLSWLLPWTSRSAVSYLSRIRREGYAVLLFPAANFYVLNLSFDNRFEEQEAGATLQRSRKEYAAELKQAASADVRASVAFRHQRWRDDGIGINRLRLKKYTYEGALIVNRRVIQFQPKAQYQRFTDDFSGGRGVALIVSQETILRRPGQGEIRFYSEAASFTERQSFTQPEFLLTDGRRFGTSGLVSLVINYDIAATLRLTVNATDRFYENRPAEFTGRGELVASF